MAVVLAPHRLSDGLTRRDAALCDIGRRLRDAGYSFVTVTPETHRRVLARRGDVPAVSLRDIFGWNLPFAANALPDAMMASLHEAGALDRHGEAWRSAVRFASLGEGLYVHSSYPTEERDAVFFGPDTYRFARLIAHELDADERPVRSALDIGCGSGAGGLFVAGRAGRGALDRLTLADVSAKALRFARVNAALAETAAEFAHSDVVASVAGRFDLIVSNPPYLVDDRARAYRHGGGTLGADLSLRVLRDGIERLAPHGRLILYAGSAIVDGRDAFREAAEAVIGAAGLRGRYEELDPDVFGEELERDAYAAADRIAAVGLVVER